MPEDYCKDWCNNLYKQRYNNYFISSGNYQLSSGFLEFTRCISIYIAL